jgi:hypothetical protein
MTLEPPIPPPPPIGARRDETVTTFMGDLRKFVLHRSLAATLTGRGGPGGNPAASLSTEVADLVEWHGWSAQGTAFLDTLQPGEQLDRALAPYKTLVVEFCAWLGKWQAAMHRGALEELHDLQQEFRHPDVVRRIDVSTPAEPEASIPESWIDQPLQRLLVS